MTNNACPACGAAKHPLLACQACGYTHRLNAASAQPTANSPVPSLRSASPRSASIPPAEPPLASGPTKQRPIITLRRRRPRLILDPEPRTCAICDQPALPDSDLCQVHMA